MGHSLVSIFTYTWRLNARIWPKQVTACDRQTLLSRKVEMFSHICFEAHLSLHKKSVQVNLQWIQLLLKQHQATQCRVQNGLTLSHKSCLAWCLMQNQSYIRVQVMRHAMISQLPHRHDAHGLNLLLQSDLMGKTCMTFMLRTQHGVGLMLKRLAYNHK